MLKVECESCKAPYQIDERRVPAAGLKMRCPKCGHSFVVKSPNAAAAPAPAAAPPAAAAAAAPPAPPRAAPRPPEPPKPAPIARPAPPAQKPVGDLDLPSPAADLPAPVARPAADLPSPVARPAGPAIQKRGDTATMIGGVAPALPPRIVKVGGVAPAHAAAPPVAAKNSFELDLPSVSAGGAKPAADVEDDLPALGGADLPSIPAGKPALKAPAAPKAARPAAPLAPDFGAELDLPSTVDAALPAVASAGLPARATVGLPATAKGASGGPRPAPPPAPAAPTAKAIKKPAGGGFGEIDLPSVANDLPAIASSLPSVAGSLPSVAGSLPVVAGSLPSVAHALPSVAQALPSVANALPSVANALPSVQGTAQQLPSIPAAFGGGGHGGETSPGFGDLGGDDFGELELPRAPNDPLAASPAWGGGGGGADAGASGGASLFDENPFTSVPPTGGGGGDDAFGELELPVAPENKPASFPPMSSPISEQRAGGAAGGMSFGELDLGGGGESTDEPIGGGEYGEATLGSVIQPPPTGPDVSRVAQLGQLPNDAGPAGNFGPSEATIDAPARPRRDRRIDRPRGPSPLPKILLGLLAVGLVGGAALTLTQYGPFGYYAISDAKNKDAYARAAVGAVETLHEGMKTDTFVDALHAADKIAAARAAKPRARALTAVAAIAELETELRFGKDPERSNRAKIWLTSEIPEPRANVRYLDVANAAVAAIDRDRDKARVAFDSVERKYAGDPILQDIDFMRGQLELRSGDGAAAETAFKKALALVPGSRAHFGLAQAAFLKGDLVAASKELSETIAASPKNGAALILRAQLSWSQGHDDVAAVAALKDLALLLEGAARDSISTEQRAQAYAQRGQIQLSRGRSAEARQAFEDALKVDGRNVAALIGQGDLFYDEGRSTEAVGRYDAAKQFDPSSIRAIVGDAKTQIKLEHLADAKTELTDAAKKFPKSALVMQWLGEAEAALGNKRDAEKDFLAAIDLVDPTDPDSIDTYAAYAEFLSKQGRAPEAQVKLLEAQKKLPDTAGLERTLGDVAEDQGLHEDAISRYKAALEKDPQDVTSRFHLGQALRRANHPDDAAKVFDQVFKADPTYPGLSLERGLLFEQAGNMTEALAQFKGALDKHPDDLDTMLRVGAALVAIGKPDEAIPNLKKVLQQRQNSAEASHYLGRAYMEKGGVSQQEAMRHLKTAVEKDPNRAEYHLYVGWLANDLTPPELGTARREIDKALDLDKTLADGYWQRGILEYVSGASDDAIRDLKLALQLKPTRYEAHASLAEVYEQKNLIDQSIAEWNLAFARDPNNELWNYKFGKELMDRGMYAEAAKHLKTATEAAEQDQPRPGWLRAAEFPAAEALRRIGDRDGAVKHYTTFLQLADQNDPNNRDARRALIQLGAPYQDDR